MSDASKKRSMATKEIEKEQHSNEEISSTVAKKQKIVHGDNDTTDARPKSKKELRQERKAALKAKAGAEGAKDPSSKDGNIEGDERLSKAEYSRLKQQRRKEEERLERKARKEAKEKAEEERFREQDRLRKEILAAGVADTPEENKLNDKSKKNKKKRERQKSKQINKSKGNDGDVDDLDVYKNLFKKRVDPTTGATACRLGVKYVDEKIGTGPGAQPKSLVTVKYQLRGGNPHGVLLDSSKKFTFRLGKGEVIQGWDIGVEGMQVGTVRNLIVPPKAGYGSQDIGAGPGAMLYFNVALLAIR